MLREIDDAGRLILNFAGLASTSLVLAKTKRAKSCGSGGTILDSWDCSFDPGGPDQAGQAEVAEHLAGTN